MADTVTLGWKQCVLLCLNMEGSELPLLLDALQHKEQKQTPQEEVFEGTEQITEDPCLGCTGDEFQVLERGPRGSSRMQSSG